MNSPMCLIRDVLTVTLSSVRRIALRSSRLAFIPALLLLGAVPVASAQSYTVSTVAGTPGLSGTSSSAGVFNTPYGLARDNNGSIYVADYGNYTIRRITPGGAVSTLAGLAGVAGTTDGVGAAARFNLPINLACDGTNLYVSDFLSHTIRKIVISTGSVTTLAGQAGVIGTADGIGTNAQFNLPCGIAWDGSANLYVADNGSHTIRKIVAATGVVSTLAGSAGSAAFADGTGFNARFNSPFGTAVDALGNIIVIDRTNKVVRRVTPAGVVTTIAGQPGASGYSDGTVGARFADPAGIAIDGASNTIFVTESSNVVRQISPAGVVSTLCGFPGTTGLVNGVGSAVRLSYPNGIVVDGTSNTLLVSEVNSQSIRRITFGGASSWWAGTPGTYGSADSVGTFSNPYACALDAGGNVYVADSGNHVIRKVTPDGKVTTFAGSPGVAGSADGTSANARFNTPSGITVDAAGNVFVGDTLNNTIRKITPSGVVTTLAGTAGMNGTTDGAGSAARFSNPYGIVSDAAGTNLYTTDFSGQIVRKIVIATGVVTTIAGLGGNAGSVDGVATAARFDGPLGVTLAPDGLSLYVADYNADIIRKIVLASASVTTVAGVANTLGSADGTGSAARFRSPRHITCDAGGNVYIADRNNHAIRKMTSSFAVTTLAGKTASVGAADGVGSSARFNNPAGVALDADGNLFVADQNNHAIRKVSPSGVVATFAGTPGLSGSTTTGYFNQPGGVVRDSLGNFYVADTVNHAIRKITPEGVIITLAGLPGTSGTTNGNGSAARFNAPFSIVLDQPNEYLYVADTSNHAIRRVNFDGDVTSVAGFPGVAGSLDGTGVGAQFNQPFGLAYHAASGTLYVADYGNHTIRKIVVATGAVTTVAGLAGNAAETDGTGGAARFNGPNGITMDPSGNLFVCDWGGHTIRKIAMPGAAVTTLAGVGGTSGTADGTGSAARFFRPNEMVADTAGNLFVTEQGNHTIRKVTPAGVVSTIAGQGLQQGFADGAGNAARMRSPAGITIDTGGVLYFADSSNHVIRKAVRTSTKAQIVSPANGSVLVDPVTTFKWNAGIGTSGYALWIGSTPGGYDLYAALEGTNLSRTVTLPAGRKIYVTLYTLVSGVYQSNSYVYEPAPSAKAVLTSPANGATLANATLSLQWSPGVGVGGYALWLGSSPNGYDLGAVALGAGITTWSGNVPTDGGPVYVTLWSLIDGAYLSNGYWFTTAALNAQRPAQITSHVNTSTLPGGNVTLNWGNAVGAAGYVLWVGSTPDGYDLYAGNEGANLTKNLTLPTDGRRLYVTLHTLISGAYQSNAYWFTSANVPPVSGAAQITSHQNGTQFAGVVTTLGWNSVAGAAKYLLWVGTKPAGYDLYAADEFLSTSRQLSMPNDGRPVYVTLYTVNGGALLSNSYYFKSANGAAGSKPALITFPGNGSGLGLTATFQWSGGVNVTSYALWVGSTPGGYDLYAADEGVALSRTISSLPTDGRKIYVTLYSLVGGVYQPVSYQYNATGALPTSITTPVNGTTFSSTSATFNWSTGASAYALWIGRSPRSYDIYAGAEGTNLNKAINGLLPNDGGPVYVTLYSLLNGTYVISDHIFNAWQQP